MNARFLPGLLAILFVTGTARAENARLPYGPLYRMEKIQMELSHAYTNLVVILRISSTNAGLKPDHLVVYIDSKSGHIPVKVAADGDFTVPLRDDLLAEQPWLVTDQPKGSMRLDWGLALAVERVSSPIRYRRLMMPVKDCEYVEERMREVLPSTSKINITGLKIIFSPDVANAYAVVHAKSGDRKMQANAANEVMIPLDKPLLDEDPEVTFSAPPDKQELAGD